MWGLSLQVIHIYFLHLVEADHQVSPILSSDFFEIYDKLLWCVTYLIILKGVNILWHAMNDKML